MGNRAARRQPRASLALGLEQHLHCRVGLRLDGEGVRGFSKVVLVLNQRFAVDVTALHESDRLTKVVTSPGPRTMEADLFAHHLVKV